MRADTVGIFDDDVLEYAEVASLDRGDAAVRPPYRGRGIGTWLATWMQQRARSRGATVVGMPVPEGSPSDLLRTALGYRVRWTSWVLKLPRGAHIEERSLPSGYVVRTARPAEHAAVHDVIEDAFLEWSDRDRETYQDFAAVTVRRPDFESWHLRVAVDLHGDIVGAATVSVVLDEEGPGTEAYISRLAVRRDQRGRGLAQALMVDAFGHAREHGAQTSGLSTDSRTRGAGPLREGRDDGDLHVGAPRDRPRVAPASIRRHQLHRRHERRRRRCPRPERCRGCRWRRTTRGGRRPTPGAVGEAGHQSRDEWREDREATPTAGGPLTPHAGAAA